MPRLLLRSALLVATLGACGSQPAGPAVAVPPAPTASAMPVVGPPPPGAPARVIALDGRGAIRKAGWLDTSAFAVTSTHVWRFRPEEPEVVKMMPLANAIGEHSVVAASPTSSLVAVGLEDGSIDLLDEKGRRRTLPPEAKYYELLDLQLSPDQSVLAASRASATWKGETTFYETATGKRLGLIEGGNVVFDATSKFVAGRGGVSRVADGKPIARFREAFWVLLDAGKFGPIETSHGEVMAGDYAERGFYEGHAFYAASKTVDFVDPETGKVTSLPVACGKSGAKAGNRADPEHGRLIAVCNDAVLITDLETRTTTRIPAAIRKEHTLFAPQILAPKNTRDFVVWTGHREDFAFLFHDGVAKRIGPEVWNDFNLRDGKEACASPGTPRSDIDCAFPALRPDGRYRLELRRGLTVKTTEGQSVIDWSILPSPQWDGPEYAWKEHGSALSLEETKTHERVVSFDASKPAAAPPISSGGCGPPPKGYMAAWYLHASDETFALYTASRGENRIVGTSVCTCTANGSCSKQELVGYEETVQDGQADGTIVTMKSLDNYQASVVMLRRPKQRAISVKIPSNCNRALFGPDRRVFASCGFLGQRRALYELAATDLAIVAQRTTPPVMHGLVRLGDELLVGSASDGLLLPIDWIKDPNVTERGELLGGATYGIELVNGKAKLAGDPEAARKLLRCYDGERLRAFDTCR